MAIDKLIPQYLSSDTDQKLVKSVEMTDNLNIRVSNNKEGTAGVVKKFDNLDKDSYPMNQTKELKTYQKAFNQLTPVQKQQVLANKNKPKKI